MPLISPCRFSEVALLLLLLHARRLVVVDRTALPLRGGGQEHLLDDLGERRRRALDRARQRIAAERAEADRAHSRRLPGLQGKALIVHHENEAVALDRRPRRREVQRHDGNLLAMDVLPDIELRPVRDGKHADTLALGLLGVVQMPELGALILGVPAVTRRTEREHPLLRPALLLVAARAAEGRIKTIEIQRLLEALG